MSFEIGQLVSRLGMAAPLKVQSISGDDITVLEWDVKRKRWRQSTYKAAELRPTPPRRPITPIF